MFTKPFKSSPRLLSSSHPCFLCPGTTARTGSTQEVKYSPGPLLWVWLNVPEIMEGILYFLKNRIKLCTNTHPSEKKKISMSVNSLLKQTNKKEASPLNALMHTKIKRSFIRKSTHCNLYFDSFQFACFSWLSWKDNWPKSTAVHPGRGWKKEISPSQTSLLCPGPHTVLSPHLINRGRYCNKRTDLSDNKTTQ